MKRNKRIKTCTKGITLIALIITIIILLILAGVAIASLTGDNGLFKRANQAKINTLDAQNAENATIKGYEDAIDYVLGAELTGVDTSVTNPEDAMPTGATVIEGNADEGIVIRDENGNEWVWVEVPKTAEVYPTAGTDLDVNNITDEQCDTIYSDLATYAGDYREEGYEDTFYPGNGFNSEPEYKTAKNNMLRSVYKNGGFWISRYEIGTDNIRISSTETLTTGYSRKGLYPYKYVTCSQAQTVASNIDVERMNTSLIFGIQWDLILKYMEEKGIMENGQKIEKEDLLVDSTNWGNYIDSSFDIISGKYSANGKVFFDVENQYTKNNGESILITTGTSSRNCILNIYDFAGNVWEWTLEKSSIEDRPCTNRGGGYDEGSRYPAANRGGNRIDTGNTRLGIRATVY